MSERHDRLMAYLDENMPRLLRDAASMRAFWEAMAMDFMNGEIDRVERELLREQTAREILEHGLRETIATLDEVARERDLYRAKAIKDL